MRILNFIDKMRKVEQNIDTYIVVLLPLIFLCVHNQRLLVNEFYNNTIKPL